MISISVLVVNWLILLNVFDSLPETVATHINIQGEVDGYGNKVNLIYGLLVNTGLLAIIFFLIKNPKYANYPLEINDSNRKAAYLKMQYFLSVLSIITSLAFSFMVTQQFTSNTPIILILVYAVTSPILILLFFKKQ
ncbi:DUF1648 domain-containing protein [Flagellimonas sp. S174]|uniref:DUF1648 domain-containing protein n=1 Tax=Flagellimonas sp. S174 TaxID=3410790 RepID=UPI003BF5BC57